MYRTTYQFWLDNAKDPQIVKQLKKMQNDDNAIKNAFYKDLEFGTAGLRGIIGAGSNCLNIYTIMRTTMGLAKYMQQNNQNKVAISYDSRIKSKTFAYTASRVLNMCGIKTYLANDCMPTPFCSYMVRYYGCSYGIMITASHNPKQYNGYKVYSSDGTQLLEEPSLAMSNIVKTIDPFKIKPRSFEYYAKHNMVEFIDDKIVASYLQHVKAQAINKMTPIKVVYTPLNGTGYKLVPQNLKECGLRVDVVKEQSYPNGNFTTCPKPNPERADAFNLAIKLGKQTNADLLLATDPDCDRVGVAVLDNGEYKLLTGNEMGVLLCDYLLSQLKSRNQLDENKIIIKSVVTTSLVEKLAKQYNVKCVNVLTGFKYIGSYITSLESQNKQNNFLIGFEESYGYLVGTYVRDKDAVVASMLICEMAGYYKQQNITLLQRLNQIYDKFGYYKHKIFTFEFAGADGNAKMKTLLKDLRAKPFKQIASFDVTKVVDYMGETEFNLPKANMLQFYLNGGGNVIVRPSGTEPLIKVYVTACTTPEQNEIDINNIKTFLDKYFV